MRGKTAVLILVLCSLSFVPASRSAGVHTPPRHMQLLETGDFHGEEVQARSGEKWLGLLITGKDSTLLPFRLKVETVYDDITDYGTGQQTGKRVSVDSPLEPLFLMTGGSMLKEGPVTTVFSAKPDFAKSLDKTQQVELKLSGKSYVLKVVGQGSEKCRWTTFPPNAQLVLALGDSEQTLYTLEDCGNDPYWLLLWAGDLDRDGKLDLYVSVTQHYNVSERRLFLSSAAGDEDLVKEVAEFVMGGC